MAERTVSVRLLALTSPYVAGMQRARAATASVATQATAMSAGIKQTGRSMANIGAQAGLLRGGLVSPITAAGAAVVGATKASIDWESAWAGVTKTVDGSSQQMERLEGDLRNMAKELPATHGEIAAVAEAAGQLGVGVDDVADFSRVMVDLGETTNLSADQAATSIARLTNIMGTSQGEVSNLGSALVDLGNNSATTEAEILTLATRLAAAGQIAGLSESDVLAFAATLTSVGVEAEAGGTALSKVFTSVRDAVVDGGSELATFAEVAGTTARDFAEQFRSDPAQAIAAFIEGLGRMNAAGQSTSGVFEDLSLTDQRLMRALLSTAEAGDLLTDSIQLSSSAFEDNTALSEEAQRRYDTMAASLSTSMSKLKDAAIDLGDLAAPVLADAATGAADLVSGLQLGITTLRELQLQAARDAGMSASQAEDLPTGFAPVDMLSQFRQNMEDLKGLASGETSVWEVLSGGADDATDSTKSFLTQLREGAESAVPGFVAALEPSAGALDQVETEARETAEQIDGLADSLFETGREAIALEEREYALSEAIDAAREASQDDSLSKADQKDRLRDVATATQDLVLDMFDQGAATDDIIGKTQNAREEFVDIATEILNDAEAAEELADKYGLIPGEVMTTVTLRDLATKDIGNIRDRLDSIDGKEARVSIINEVIENRRVNTYFSTFGNQGRGGQDFHSGGQIMHDGGQISTAPRMHNGGLRPDERVIIAQSGEFMMQRSAVDRAGLPFMHAVNQGNLDRAMAPIARRGAAGGNGGAMEVRHTFVGAGPQGEVFAQMANEALRRGQLNIKSEAIAR